MAGLAAATGMDPDEVAADLELSRWRRDFVVHEQLHLLAADVTESNWRSMLAS